MKLYRDIQPGEELQVGDMWRVANEPDAEWQTITADDIAEAPEGGRTVTSVEESGIEYRRPVDLPVLQRVTPEAMSELEQRDRATIVTCDHDAAWVYRWARGIRWTANRRPATRPAFGWFVDLTTIPEVQQ